MIHSGSCSERAVVVLVVHCDDAVMLIWYHSVLSAVPFQLPIRFDLDAIHLSVCALLLEVMMMPCSLIRYSVVGLYSFRDRAFVSLVDSFLVHSFGVYFVISTCFLIYDVVFLVHSFCCHLLHSSLLLYVDHCVDLGICSFVVSVFHLSCYILLFVLYSFLLSVLSSCLSFLSHFVPGRYMLGG